MPFSTTEPCAVDLSRVDWAGAPTDLRVRIAAGFQLPGEKVWPRSSSKASREATADLVRALGDDELTISEMRVKIEGDAASGACYSVDYRFSGYPDFLDSGFFDPAPAVEHLFGALLKRHGCFWLVPIDGYGEEFGVAGPARRLAPVLGRPARAAMGAADPVLGALTGTAGHTAPDRGQGLVPEPLEGAALGTPAGAEMPEGASGGSNDEAFFEEISTIPLVGEFHLVPFGRPSETDDRSSPRRPPAQRSTARWTVDALPWWVDANDRQVRLAEQGVDEEHCRGLLEALAADVLAVDLGGVDMPAANGLKTAGDAEAHVRSLGRQAYERFWADYDEACHRYGEVRRALETTYPNAGEAHWLLRELAERTFGTIGVTDADLQEDAEATADLRRRIVEFLGADRAEGSVDPTPPEAIPAETIPADADECQPERPAP